MPRVLIIKLGAIGDVIMAVPAAYAMKQAGYDVDWVCGKSIAPLLALYPWINVIPVDDAALLRGSLMARLGGVLSLWRKIAGRRYAVAATLYYERTLQGFHAACTRSAEDLPVPHRTRLPAASGPATYKRVHGYFDGSPGWRDANMVAPLRPL